MAIDVKTGEMIERTAEEVLAMLPHKRFKAIQRPVGPIPPDQKVAVLTVGLHPGVRVTDHAALIAAIEGITGIHICKVMAFGKAPAAVPQGQEITLTVESGFGFRPTEG